MLLASARNSECFEEMLQHNFNLHHVNEIDDTAFIYLSRINKFNNLQKLVSHAQSMEDIDKFDEQRRKIFNIRSKKQYIEAVKADNFSIEILEKARLHFKIQSSLSDKPVVKNYKI